MVSREAAAAERGLRCRHLGPEIQERDLSVLARLRLPGLPRQTGATPGEVGGRSASWHDLHRRADAPGPCGVRTQAGAGVCPGRRREQPWPHPRGRASRLTETQLALNLSAAPARARKPQRGSLDDGLGNAPCGSAWLPSNCARTAEGGEVETILPCARWW